MFSAHFRHSRQVRRGGDKVSDTGRDLGAAVGYGGAPCASSETEELSNL